MPPYSAKFATPDLKKVGPPPPPASGSVSDLARRGELEKLKDLKTLEEDCKDDTNTALIWAIDAGQKETGKWLIEKYVEDFAVNKSANTSSSKLDSQSFLDLSPLFARGYLGSTALVRACRLGDVESTRALLEAANKIVGDSSGAREFAGIHNEKLQYPMHFAAFQQHVEVLECMLSFNADTFVLDRKGRTPAEDTKSEAIRNIILEHRKSLAAPAL
eukprot:TRINITY_DN28645_c0_g1_i1.p1 TRINITY_DN28645_c0_g1~~TRINITY_DN28645_c0_g1_i1.p1  ORF type:complete len:217 (+),score=42.84 TRINITY_DN28645_c0_g1_i1:306-956(+)